MADALETNVEAEDVYRLPEAEEEAAGVMNLNAVQRRIREVARVLDNFKALRDPGRPRKEYIEQVWDAHSFSPGQLHSKTRCLLDGI